MERKRDKQMTEEEKWNEVLACNSEYDGVFFYGVRTTVIFCRPSCKSKSPKRENILFFDNTEQARDKGFRPCKRCRPDLLSFQPQKDVADKIKSVYDLYFTEHKQLKEELQKLGLSRNRITQLFQLEYKMTPVEYINALRISHAKKMLVNTQDSILQIALQSGFESLSTFYSHFRRFTGVSPMEYRETVNKINPN